MYGPEPHPDNMLLFNSSRHDLNSLINSVFCIRPVRVTVPPDFLKTVSLNKSAYKSRRPSLYTATVILFLLDMLIARGNLLTSDMSC